MPGNNPYPMTVDDPAVIAELEDQRQEEKASNQKLPLNCIKSLNGRSDRQAFIIKVYGIVWCILAITTLCCGIVMASPEIQTWMVDHWYLHLVALGLGFTLMVLLMCPCFKKIQRKVPMNYIVLFVFTLCFSYMTAGFCSWFNPVSVLCSAVTTTCMVFSLTLLAVLMKSEQVEFCLGFVSAFVMCFLCALLFSLLYPTLLMYVVI